MHQNQYLGNKIKQIQKGIGKYNSYRTIEEYKKSKELSDKIAERSKYKNMLLNVISPFTYEKRLNKLLEKKNFNKRLSPAITKPQFYNFNNTISGFYRDKKINNLDDFYSKENNKAFDDSEKKIVIERENMMSTTNGETETKI